MDKILSIYLPAFLLGSSFAFGGFVCLVAVAVVLVVVFFIANS